MTAAAGGRGAPARGLRPGAPQCPARSEPPARREAGGGERGQAAAELALVLPFVGLLLLVVVQVAVVVRDQVLVVHAAREAAREAAVDPDPAAARRAALRSAPLVAGRLRLTTQSGGRAGMVAVEVRYAAATDVPLAGLLLPDVTLRASAAMRKEW